MAKIVLTNPSITVNSVDLSDHIAKVTINIKKDEVDTTAFGSTGKTRVGGLEDSSISIDFHQDFASGSVEATLFPLLGTTTTVVVKPVNTTTSTTNPAYTASVLCTEWAPVDGSVGDLMAPSVTWPVSGTVARTTS